MPRGKAATKAAAKPAKEEKKTRKPRKRAQKWLLGSAMLILHDPEKKVERQEIARKYPLTATATIEEIWTALGQLDFVTCRKLEAVLRGKDVEDEDEDSAEDEGDDEAEDEDEESSDDDDDDEDEDEDSDDESEEDEDE